MPRQIEQQQRKVSFAVDGDQEITFQNVAREHYPQVYYNKKELDRIFKKELVALNQSMWDAVVYDSHENLNQMAAAMEDHTGVTWRGLEYEQDGINKRDKVYEQYTRLVLREQRRLCRKGSNDPEALRKVAKALSKADRERSLKLAERDAKSAGTSSKSHKLSSRPSIRSSTSPKKAGSKSFPQPKSFSLMSMATTFAPPASTSKKIASVPTACRTAVVAKQSLEQSLKQTVADMNVWC